MKRPYMVTTYFERDVPGAYYQSILGVGAVAARTDAEAELCARQQIRKATIGSEVRTYALPLPTVLQDIEGRVYRLTFVLAGEGGTGPDNAASREALQAAILIALQALEFYGTPDNYRRRRAVLDDGGAIAQAAITALAEAVDTMQGGI